MSSSYRHLGSSGVPRCAQVDWRPYRQWNLGAAYGWERHDWHRADVDAANEHSVKLFADFKPTEVSLGTWRAS